jgi:hypothetical protein
MFFSPEHRRLRQALASKFCETRRVSKACNGQFVLKAAKCVDADSVLLS